MPKLFNIVSYLYQIYLNKAAKKNKPYPILHFEWIFYIYDIVTPCTWSFRKCWFNELCKSWHTYEMLTRFRFHIQYQKYHIHNIINVLRQVFNYWKASSWWWRQVSKILITAGMNFYHCQQILWVVFLEVTGLLS